MSVEYIIKAVVQILFLTYCFYKFYVATKSTKAARSVLIIMWYGIVYMLSYILKLTAIENVVRLMFIPAMMFAMILYQPELRRVFGSGIRNSSRGRGVRTSPESIDAIVGACEMLAGKKRGALVVFPRKINIRTTIDTGTRMNAEISASLVGTVFQYDTALHDGAMVVEGDKIVASGCYLPLSSQADISANFGTRHRAALGLAEESDAVVLIVSEETSAMSLAYNATLYYDLDGDTIRTTILSLLSDMDAQSNTEA